MLVGFRAPLKDGKALVVGLDNPGPFADGAAGAQWSGPWWLDLGGLGIRSLEADGSGGAWVIAGPADRSNAPPALFRWGGPSAPDQVARIALDFGDLNPEAIVRIGADWWVLSDDGRRKSGPEDRCKDLPRSQQRARTARIVGLTSEAGRAGPVP